MNFREINELPEYQVNNLINVVLTFWHVRQLVAPGSPEYSPAGHVSQESFPGATWNLLGGQSVHTVFPSSNFPYEMWWYYYLFYHLSE